MDEKMINEILDKLVQEAGPIAIEEMEKEDLVNLDKPEFEFSEEHEEKMRQIFDAVEKESLKKAKEMKKMGTDKATKGTPFKKVLVILAATIAILAIAITSVGAWRESLVKYVLNIKEEYSDIKTNNTWINKKAKDCWVEDIYFGYLPNDYEFKSKKVLSTKTIVYFENSGHLFITYEMDNSTIVYPQVNTESGEIREVIINGKDMVYCENGQYKFLTWNENNKTNILSTNDSKEILLKIVENINISNSESQSK